MNIIECRGIVKRFGDYTALNSVSFEIPQAKIFGLLGPNGAGKTTLIRIINQITLPDAGEIIFDGKPIKPLGQVEKLDMCKGFTLYREYSS